MYSKDLAGLDLNYLKIVIFEALDLAAVILKKHYRTDFSASLKGHNNPVTEVDLLVEEALKKFLYKKVPNAGFTGEETNPSGGKDFFFCLDPIDGTKAYLSGYPMFCTLLGVCIKDEVLMGAIDSCITNERWFGSSKKTIFSSPNFFDGQVVCKTSNIQSLQQARLAATDVNMFNASQMVKFKKLSSKAKITRWGGDAYNYGCLASGNLDLIMEADMKFYDLAALIPVVKAAGGVITDWQNGQLSPNNYSQVLASANLTLHKKALEVISEH